MDNTKKLEFIDIKGTSHFLTKKQFNRLIERLVKISKARHTIKVIKEME